MRNPKDPIRLRAGSWPEVAANVQKSAEAVQIGLSK